MPQGKGKLKGVRPASEKQYYSIFESEIYEKPEFTPLTWDQLVAEKENVDNIRLSRTLSDLSPKPLIQLRQAAEHMRRKGPSAQAYASSKEEYPKRDTPGDVPKGSYWRLKQAEPPKKPSLTDAPADPWEESEVMKRPRRKIIY